MGDIEQLRKEVQELMAIQKKDAQLRAIEKEEKAKRREEKENAKILQEEEIAKKDKAIEQLILRATLGDKYFNYEFASPSSGKTLPKTFVTMDLSTFKVTHNPKIHFSGFVGALALKGVDRSLYASTFPH